MALDQRGNFAAFSAKTACGSTHQSEPVGAGGPTQDELDRICTQAAREALKGLETKGVSVPSPPHAPRYLQSKEAIQWLTWGQIDVLVIDDQTVNFYWCVPLTRREQLFCQRQLFVTAGEHLMQTDIFTC